MRTLQFIFVTALIVSKPISFTDEKIINLNKRKGTNSLVVTDGATIDGSRRMISRMYRSISFG